MKAVHHIDRLSFRLLAAGMLMLLAFLPLAFPNDGVVKPVSAYGKASLPGTSGQAPPTVSSAR